MKKRKELKISEQWNDAVMYLKESKKYIYGAIGLFLLSTIVGFMFKDQLGFIEGYLAELLARTADYGVIEMIFFILQNNLQSSLFAVLLGIVFGVFPIFSSISNGVILGYVLARTFEVAGILSWWRILPHGIFELPAIFISFGIGIKLGFSLFLPRRQRIKEFKRRFYHSVNLFLMMIIPLLIVAAIIEGLLIVFLS